MRYLWFFLMVIMAGACSHQPVSTPALNDTNTTASEKPEGQHYCVDKAASEVRIISYPDGRLGHAHVIGGPVIDGDIVVPENTNQVWLKLAINVNELAVDRPQWRRDEKLDPEMSERAINGTRDNMLSDRLLNATAYPQILIEADSAMGPSWQKDVMAQITLRGNSQHITVPVAIIEHDNELEVIGRIEILQSDFGIEPFSALGGIMRVADKLLIRFRIHARPV